MDDVAVGEDEAVRSDHDARSGAAVGVDLDDGGSDCVYRIDDRAGVGIEQLVVVLEPVGLEGHGIDRRSRSTTEHHPNGLPFWVVGADTRVRPYEIM